MVLAYRWRWFFRTWYATLVPWNAWTFYSDGLAEHKWSAIAACFAAIVWIVLELRYLQRTCGIMRLTGRPGMVVERGALFTAVNEPRFRSLHKAWANREGVAEVLIEEVQDG